MLNKQSVILPPNPKALLIGEYGPQLGMGHLYRLLAYAQQLLSYGILPYFELYLVEGPNSRNGNRIEAGFSGPSLDAEDFAQALQLSSSTIKSLFTEDQRTKLWLQSLSVKQLEEMKESQVYRGLEQGEYIVCAVDSYHLPSEFYQNIAQTKTILLALDDFQRIPYPANSLVIQASHPPESQQLASTAAKSSRILRGLQYQVLRSEFQPPAEPPELAPKPYNILIAMGSGFDNDISSQLLEAFVLYLDSFQQPLNLHIIFSQTHKLLAKEVGVQLKEQFSSTKCFFYSGQSASMLSDLYSKMHLCISPCSQSALELYRCGHEPLLFLSADNQEQLLKTLLASGLSSPKGYIDLRPWSTGYSKGWGPASSLKLMRDILHQATRSAIPRIKGIFNSASDAAGLWGPQSSSPIPQLDGGAMGRILEAAFGPIEQFAEHTAIERTDR